MTVVDWQFYSSLLCYVQYFSRISAENVGSQPRFSHIFLLIVTIRVSQISADISFQPSGVIKKFGLGSTVDGPTSRDFSSIYIVRELWGLKSEAVEAFSRKVAFLEKTPYGKICKNLFQKDSSQYRSTYCVQIS